MIPENYIREWKGHAPWKTDAMVEQDLVICRSLVALFSDAVLSAHLAFRGGTALHKLCLAPAWRYSEDIDLVQIVGGPIGPIFDALHTTMDPLCGEPRRKQGPGVVTLTYRMPGTGPLSPTLRLKVEINSREHFTVLGLKPAPLPSRRDGSRGPATSRPTGSTNCWGRSSVPSTSGGRVATFSICGWG